MNWLVDPLPLGSRLQLQVRHRARATPGEIVRIDGDEIELALDEPVTAITPGQSLVLYDGDRVIGGAFIDRGGAAARTTLPVLAA